MQQAQLNSHEFCLSVRRHGGDAVLNFIYSSSYPIPLTDPQQYYVWEGTDLTLSCNYTLASTNQSRLFLTLARGTASNVSTADPDHIVTFQQHELDPLGWMTTCYGSGSRDFGCRPLAYPSNDTLTGGVSITAARFNEMNEDGQYQCQLRLLFASFSEVINLDRGTS